jgi:hypothetical protein
MITTLLKDDLPILQFLGIEVSVIKNNDHITNMVDCEVPAGGKVVAKITEMRDHMNYIAKALNDKRA